MELHYTIYQKLYDLLYDRFLNRETRNLSPKKAKADRGILLWEEPLPDKKDYKAASYFRGHRANSHKYFYNKSLTLVGRDNHPKGVDWDEIDDLSLFKAFVYLDFYKERGKGEAADRVQTFDFKEIYEENKWSAIFSMPRLKSMYKQFLEQHMPDYNPEDYPRPLSSEAPKTKDSLRDSVLTPDTMNKKSQNALAALTSEIQSAINKQDVGDYLSLKGYILNLFSVAEEFLPIPVIYDVSPLVETDDVEQIRTHRFGEGEVERLYQYILNPLKQKEKRKNALRVFTVHKGLSDEQIIAVFYTDELGVFRMATEHLDALVSEDNDTGVICKAAVDFALEKKELGANKRICLHLFRVNYPAAVLELQRLFAIVAVYIPNNIMEGLLNALTDNRSLLVTAAVADDTMALAQRCLDYDPVSPQLLNKFSAIQSIVQEVRSQNGWG